MGMTTLEMLKEMAEKVRIATELYENGSLEASEMALDKALSLGGRTCNAINKEEYNRKFGA